MLLYLVSFNLARALVDPALLGATLFDGLPSSSVLPDVIVCSLQEVAPIAYSFLGGSYLTPYFDRIHASVRVAAKKHADDEHAYRSVTVRAVGMTGIMVFAKPELADRIRWIQTASVGVGLWGMGNKGAVGVRLGLAPHEDSEDETELTFVAAHLAPMEDGLTRRIEDWENIVRNLVFEPAADHAASKRAGNRAVESAVDRDNANEAEQEPFISSSYTSGAASAIHGLYSPTSHVFFAGDLNFRTHDAGPGPKDHHSFPQPDHPEDSPKHYSRLLTTDQLQRERSAGRILQGFDELRITFPPTYKYSSRRPADTRSPDAAAVVTTSVSSSDRTVQQAETWAWAKHRWPSWCDRILFIPPPPQPQSSSTSSSNSAFSFKPLKYTSLPLLPSSDHQPVALSVSLSPTPLAPPHQEGDRNDFRLNPPFPLNPNWKQQRDTARQRELAVGVLAYLALTWEGNGLLLALVLGAWGVGAVVKSLT